MWAVLQCFGFGEHFVSMIKTLYHSPAASVITGNIISPSFPLQRGTRQGCPLSPLLFCLSLEPLAQAIRKSEVSIKIHDHNHCISLYADDIILYLDHFDVSVSSVIKEFDNFSSLSGYKINWSKSALMPINNVKVNFSIPSFIPIKESFIYLGITIYKNIHKIARDNFNNIFVKVKNDIQRWKNLKVSLQGRISTVKMNLLPRLNFFFSMLPLSPPPGYFKEINSIISKFIWNDKCPRIKLTTLQHPNSAGGLSGPLRGPDLDYTHPNTGQESQAKTVPSATAEKIQGLTNNPENFLCRDHRKCFVSVHLSVVWKQLQPRLQSLAESCALS